MKKMFGSMMQEFFSGRSEEDKQKMTSHFKKMASMCPCMNVSDMTEDDKKALLERMQSCRDGMAETMSVLFEKTGAKPGQTGSSDKA